MMNMPKGFSVKRTLNEAMGIAKLEFSFQADVILEITSESELDLSYQEHTYQYAMQALAQHVIREMEEYK
jgi:hypothetical protein